MNALTPKQVADRLGIGEAVVRRLVEANGIRPVGGVIPFEDFELLRDAYVRDLATDLANDF